MKRLCQSTPLSGTRPQASRQGIKEPRASRPSQQQLRARLARLAQPRLCPDLCTRGGPLGAGWAGRRHQGRHYARHPCAAPTSVQGGRVHHRRQQQPGGQSACMHCSNCSEHYDSGFSAKRLRQPLTFAVRPSGVPAAMRCMSCSAAGPTLAGPQVTDGAAALMLMTQGEAARRGLPILGTFRRCVPAPKPSCCQPCWHANGRRLHRRILQRQLRVGAPLHSCNSTLGRCIPAHSRLRTYAASPSCTLSLHPSCVAALRQWGCRPQCWASALRWPSLGRCRRQACGWRILMCTRSTRPLPRRQAVAAFPPAPAGMLGVCGMRRFLPAAGLGQVPGLQGIGSGAAPRRAGLEPAAVRQTPDCGALP